MENQGAIGNGKKTGESKKSVREEKQRDAKMEDQIEKMIKSLGNSAPEEKIATLARNLLELETVHHRQTTTLKQNEKSFDALQREKDRLQIEYNKGVLIKHKLEQVCREQQKIMKSIKSESLSKIRDEEEKRKETQQHFQQSINEIVTTLGKNNDENTKLKEANLEMTKKFKYLADQYEIREKQLMKMNEQINLSTQLNEAKLAKLKMESTIEREILLKEKETTLEDLLTAKKMIVDVQGRERILKEQLNMYTEKYADFQSSLKKSNDVFETYKNEITKMAKKIKALEKETYEWRSKHEKSTKAMLEMATDKTAQDQYVAKAARQLNQLQKLCRTLQAERSSLIEVLKANNIERPPMPELPPEPVIEPPPKSADKLDMMSRSCTELKKTLALLQGQMNALTAEKSVKDASVDENVPVKKSKNKKNKAKTCPIKDRNAGGAAKVVNSDDKTANQNVEPIENDEVTQNASNAESVAVGQENVSAAETTKINQMAERMISEQNDAPAEGETTSIASEEAQVTNLVNELVESIKENCSLNEACLSSEPVASVSIEEQLSNSKTDDVIEGTSSETIANGELDAVVGVTHNEVENVLPVGISTT